MRTKDIIFKKWFDSLVQNTHFFHFLFLRRFWIWSPSNVKQPQSKKCIEDCQSKKLPMFNFISNSTGVQRVHNVDISMQDGKHNQDNAVWNPRVFRRNVKTKCGSHLSISLARKQSIQYSKLTYMDSIIIHWRKGSITKVWAV